MTVLADVSPRRRDVRMMTIPRFLPHVNVSVESRALSAVRASPAVTRRAEGDADSRGARGGMFIDDSTLIHGLLQNM